MKYTKEGSYDLMTALVRNIFETKINHKELKKNLLNKYGSLGVLTDYESKKLNHYRNQEVYDKKFIRSKLMDVWCDCSNFEINKLIKLYEEI